MLSNSNPRIVISGLSGDSGKTMVSCGLLAYLKQQGMSVSGFKKGPDYIDSAWLSLASSKPARNLDTYLMGFPIAKKSFLKNAVNNEINIIEGNRGLFDGADNQGTHSTAELAKLLQAPVIIVQNISKVTRTAAASILGSIKLDPELNIAGVILNNVAGERHGKIAKDAIEDITGIPVIGTIPKLPENYILPSRHLGLITPDEFEQKSVILDDLRKVIEEYVDIPQILEIAGSATLLEDEEPETYRDEFHLDKEKVKIGFFKDQAFSFYYPENLENLTAAGAELIPISAIHNNDLENLDALYIGGGFPETNLINLTLNHELIVSLKQLAEDGFPIYAECGGLMYLAEEIEWKGRKYELSGILPIKIKMHDKPQGHGYCEATVDEDNPFYEKGTFIKGHEFHYSKIYEYDSELKSSLAISRGVGCFEKRDGLTYKNVFACYIHTHALSTPEWGKGMMACARNYQDLKKTKILIEG